MTTASTTPTPNYCQASREEQLRYATDIVMLYRTDELGGLRDAEVSAGKSKKFHENAFGVADKMMQWKPLRGGETTGEKVVTALSFGVAGVLVRAGRAMEKGGSFAEKVTGHLPDWFKDASETSTPVLGRILMTYSGMKGGEVLERWVDKGRYAQMQDITADEFTRTFTTEMPDSAKGKLPPQVRATPEASREWMLARAKEQLADPKFQKANPVEYARLRNEVSQIEQKRILSVRVLKKEIEAITASGDEWEKQVLGAYEKKLGVQVKESVKAGQEVAAHKRKIEESTRRRRVLAQLLGGTIGFLAPNIVRAATSLFKDTAPAGSGATLPGGGEPGTGDPETLPGGGEPKVVPDTKGGGGDAPENIKPKPPHVDTKPPIYGVRVPSVEADKLYAVQKGEGISHVLMRQFIDRGEKRGEALQHAIKLLMDKGDIHIKDPDTGHEFTFDEIKAKLDAGEKITDIYKKFNVHETGVRHVGERYILNANGTGYTEQHTWGEDIRPGGGVTDKHEYIIDRSSKMGPAARIEPLSVKGSPSVAFVLPQQELAGGGGTTSSLFTEQKMGGRTMGNWIAEFERSYGRLTGPYKGTGSDLSRLDWNSLVPAAEDVNGKNIGQAHEKIDNALDAIKRLQKVFSEDYEDIKHTGNADSYEQGKKVLTELRTRAQEALAQVQYMEEVMKNAAKAAKKLGVEFVYNKKGMLTGIEGRHISSPEALKEAQHGFPMKTKEYESLGRAAEKLTGQQTPIAHVLATQSVSPETAHDQVVSQFPAQETTASPEAPKAESAPITSQAADEFRQQYHIDEDKAGMVRGLMANFFHPTSPEMTQAVSGSFAAYQAEHLHDGMEFKDIEAYKAAVASLAEKLPAFPQLDLTTVEPEEARAIQTVIDQYQKAEASLTPRERVLLDSFRRVAEYLLEHPRS